jgi:outer membrane immunogenic protein
MPFAFRLLDEQSGYVSAMRRLSPSVFAAVSLIATSLGASAADLGAFPPLVPIYNWTGFYVGGHVGDAESTGTLTNSLIGASVATDKNGAVGGSQLGYNLQMGNIVLGAEWDFDGADLDTARTTTLLAGAANIGWITTLAGRIGFAADKWLYYGKAGAGWLNDKVTLTNVATGASVSGSNTNSGWLLGAGIEYALPPTVPTVAPSWSVRLEYDYLGLSTWNSNVLSVSRQIQTLTVGVNYRFN